ncbi:MAG: undecaprenyldiphospho-muramoylpentapeptide beta-N-acetylglucosaminyltransferase [Mariprofundaceae bacterium]|nr:undecaprenyldiphospho-muramoylpentapeptide beta-N-acetylglucosaminyltransferase [Mariprofundaceae bacterium]
MKKKQAYMCVAGGGTGGHIMPALALADAVRETYSDINVEFIGTDYGLEATMLPERGEKVHLLKMRAVQGKSWLQKLIVYFVALPMAVLQVCWLWRKQRPIVVVGVGGYASVASVLAAIICRIPVVLYEQNAIPGMVNRRLARWCQVMMLGFKQAEQFLARVRCVDTGNIVAKNLSEPALKKHAEPCLLILGGSQGARFLNQEIPKVCALLAQEGHVFNVVHQCGRAEGMVEQVSQAYEQANVRAEVLGFCADMPGFYHRGDVLMARSGAMTVSEAAMQGLASVFIPYPYAADDHQFYNAQVMMEGGAALVMREEGLSTEILATQLKQLLFDKTKLRSMHQAARAVAPVDATAKQLDVLKPYLCKRKNSEG